MNDFDAFEKGMIENPDDRTLQLVFADWLHDRGLDPEYEAMLRARDRSWDIRQHAMYNKPVEELSNFGTELGQRLFRRDTLKESFKVWDNYLLMMSTCKGILDDVTKKGLDLTTIKWDEPPLPPLNNFRMLDFQPIIPKGPVIIGPLELDEEKDGRK